MDAIQMYIMEHFCSKCRAGYNIVTIDTALVPPYLRCHIANSLAKPSETSLLQIKEEAERSKKNNRNFRDSGRGGGHQRTKRACRRDLVGGVVQAKFIFPEFVGIGRRRTAMTAGGDDGDDKRDNRQWW
ncbi:hypothetical protein B0H13DRAFT_1922605 [Mycena leptocephala]|nr:hypothetical protein B0H13DRAFT_1922605 [Mycena leptocephala]